MYSLFINDVLIDSSEDFDILVQKRYSKILELLENGYQYANDKDKQNERQTMIELIKDDDIKKLLIVWSGNTVDDINKVENNSINNEITDNEIINNEIIKDNNIENNEIEGNADTIKDQNKNNGIDINDTNINDINIDNIDINTDTDTNNNIIINDSTENNQSAAENINVIKNNIINAIISALNTLEYDSTFIPSKTFAQQIQILFNNQEYISYKQQFLTSILAGKSEHEIVIPIKQNDDLVNIYTLCYVLIVRGYLAANYKIIYWYN